MCHTDAVINSSHFTFSVISLCHLCEAKAGMVLIFLLCIANIVYKVKCLSINMTLSILILKTIFICYRQNGMICGKYTNFNYMDHKNTSVGNDVYTRTHACMHNDEGDQ